MSVVMETPGWTGMGGQPWGAGTGWGARWLQPGCGAGVTAPGDTPGPGEGLLELGVLEPGPGPGGCERYQGLDNLAGTPRASPWGLGTPGLLTGARGTCKPHCQVMGTLAMAWGV